MAKKVLVVDDEKLIVKGIRFSLEQDGMEVDCAYDGEEAPYLEQKLDELVEKYDFLVTRRGKGLMQGVVCKLPVGKVAAAALEQGLIVITAGADVLRFVPPLVIEKQHVDEMIEKLEKALLSVQE
jgi:acetylornithine/N-succinyldiaminopimelate aminotransferase